MSQEDVYTSMGDASSGTPYAPSYLNQRRPISRLLSAGESSRINFSSDLPGSRLSRSQTMMHSTSNGRPSTLTSPHQMSPTMFTKHSPSKSPTRRIHGSVDNSDFSNPQSPFGSISTLQRSMTAKSGAAIYGKNLWDDDDEYVESSGISPTARSITPVGGPASRRIEQKRKMQTVKLPKNPFIEDDYADMTGHLNRESGMVELRNQHQYKSMKVRSPKAARNMELEQFNDVDSVDDVDLSRIRNESVSSQRNYTGFKRSDTSPVMMTTSSFSDNTNKDFHERGHLNHAVNIVEVDGPTTHRSGSSSARAIPLGSDHSERQDTLKKEPLKISKSLGPSLNPEIQVPSPSHSNISRETTATFLPQSIPASPVVLFKKEQGSTLDTHVAVVIEETGPTSPMYAGLRAKGGSEGTESSDAMKSNPANLHFEPPSSKKCPRHVTIFFIVLVCILAAALIITVALLVLKMNQQQDEIESLKQQLHATEGLTTTSDPISAGSGHNLTTGNDETTTAITDWTSSDTTVTEIPTEPTTTISSELPEIISTASTELSTTSSSVQSVGLLETTALPGTTTVNNATSA